MVRFTMNQFQFVMFIFFLFFPLPYSKESSMANHHQPMDPLLPPSPPYLTDQPPHSQLLIPSDYILCLHIRRRRRSFCSCKASYFIPITSVLLTLLILVPFLVFIWPTDPDIGITNLHIEHLHIYAPPRASIDLKLRVNISVENPNFFALDYKSLNSSMSYRGKLLGEVDAAGGAVKAKGDSKLKAEVEIDGVRVLDEVVYLIEDLAKGSVPLDTVTTVQGSICAFFFFKFPVKGTISCSLNVNPKTQKILRQDCYPE